MLNYIFFQYYSSVYFLILQCIFFNLTIHVFTMLWYLRLATTYAGTCGTRVHHGTATRRRWHSRRRAQQAGTVAGARLGTAGAAARGTFFHAGWPAQ
jgi:hypothetical protein